jgi:large subunit ribosomal protein L17
MRHRKHSNQLGLTKEHRLAVMANMSSSLIKEGKIKTTLKKAKALRPFVEKVITLAKKGSLHDRRMAIARVRDTDAVHMLFDERAEQFANRTGGYTRIYKIGTRIGDAAEMALIELIEADDEGYGNKSKPSAKAKKEAQPIAEEAKVEDAKPEVAAEKPVAEVEAETEKKEDA